MALPLWGNLQKAQDDAETIEQAIARLIGVHEENPEAHLGEGESLAQHKKAEVIDHPPQSIVPDKFTTDQLTLITNFQPYSDFEYSNIFTASKPVGVLFANGDTEPNTGYIEANIYNVIGAEVATYDILFDISMYGEYAREDMNIKIGASNGARTVYNYGFELNDEEIKGFVRMGSTTYYTPVIATFDYYDRKTLRFFYDYVAQKISFYVNGYLAYEMEVIDDIESTGLFSIKLNNTGSEPSTFGFFNLNFRRSY